MSMLFPAVLLNLEIRKARKEQEKIMEKTIEKADEKVAEIKSLRLTGEAEQKQLEETAKLLPPVLETYNEPINTGQNNEPVA